LWLSDISVAVEADSGAWFAGNVSSTLTTLASLYRAAEGDAEEPRAIKFLQKRKFS
jgi:hypothetical protein